MTTFRTSAKEGFEKKFAHDEELRFKANARRNKPSRAYGLQANSGSVGRTPNAYAKEVVVADFRKRPATTDVFRKVRKDFDAKGR